MPDFEKLTVNLTPVDLGKIELLVEQGFYATRTEFIRAAIHDQLAKYDDTVKETATRQAYVVGALAYDRRSLEETKRKHHHLAIRVIGLLSIDDDVPPQLARDVIASIHVKGMFKATPEVKTALADRTA